jgi:hypothetical protein
MFSSSASRGSGDLSLTLFGQGFRKVGGFFSTFRKRELSRCSVTFGCSCRVFSLNGSSCVGLFSFLASGGCGGLVLRSTLFRQVLRTLGGISFGFSDCGLSRSAVWCWWSCVALYSVHTSSCIG